MNQNEYRINPLEYRRSRILKENDLFLNSGVDGQIFRNIFWTV